MFPFHCMHFGTLFYSFRTKTSIMAFCSSCIYNDGVYSTIHIYTHGAVSFSLYNTRIYRYTYYKWLPLKYSIHPRAIPYTHTNTMIQVTMVTRRHHAQFNRNEQEPLLKVKKKSGVVFLLFSTSTFLRPTFLLLSFLRKCTISRELQQF